MFPQWMSLRFPSSLHRSANNEGIYHAVDTTPFPRFPSIDVSTIRAFVSIIIYPSTTFLGYPQTMYLLESFNKDNHY